MSDLVVAAFGEELRAEEVRLDLLRMEKAHLADLEDAVVLIRTKKGKVKLHHATHLTLSGGMTGGFLGALMGLILLNPVFSIIGLVAGSAIGAVSGSLSHAGIDEDFMKDLSEHLKPGTSALCILVSEHLDLVLEELNRFGGRVFQTSLLHEDVTKLESALDALRFNTGVQE